MCNNKLRTKCDLHFPDVSCLRKLASEIACLDWQGAKQNGLLSAEPAPFNLLANGETGTGWTPPAQILPLDLIEWKNAANGFGGPTQRGLALMFDPFVDACLLIEARKNGGPFQQKTKVLVLTDYSPLKHVIGEMSVLPGQDWAAVETENFFNARNLGTSGNNIFKALFGLDSIEKVRDEGCEKITEPFSGNRLLIWNYFPFMRGGSHCEGVKGLPDLKNCAWIRYCDELLVRFLNCVNAGAVIFAVNQDVRGAREACVGDLETLNVKNRCVYRTMSHPRSWQMQKEGAEFRKLLESIDLCPTLPE